MSSIDTSPINVARPLATQRYQFNFSLRTLVIVVLFVGSAGFLLTNAAPWKLALPFSSYNSHFPVAISPNARFAAVWTRDAVLTLYDRTTGTSHPILTWDDVAHIDIKGMLLLPNDRLVLLPALTDTNGMTRPAGITVIDLTTNARSTISVNNLSPSVAFSAAFSSDGSRLAILDANGTIEIWDLASGKRTLTVDPERDTPNSNEDLDQGLAFSPSGNSLAAAGCRWGVIIDTISGRILTRLSASNDGHEWPGNFVHISFSADGTEVFYWGFPGSRHIFDNRKLTFSTTNGTLISSRWGDDVPLREVSLTGQFRVNGLGIWQYHHPDRWWGITLLPEFWLTALFGSMLVWSIYRRITISPSQPAPGLRP